MNHHHLRHPATTGKPAYSLSPDERGEVLALFSKLIEIASDIDRLVDGALPDASTQTQWRQLLQAVVDTTSAIRKHYRFRW